MRVDLGSHMHYLLGIMGRPTQRKKWYHFSVSEWIGYGITIVGFISWLFLDAGLYKLGIFRATPTVECKFSSDYVDGSLHALDPIRVKVEVANDNPVETTSYRLFFSHAHRIEGSPHLEAVEISSISKHDRSRSVYFEIFSSASKQVDTLTTYLVTRTNNDTVEVKAHPFRVE